MKLVDIPAGAFLWVTTLTATYAIGGYMLTVVFFAATILYLAVVLLVALRKERLAHRARRQ